MSGDVIRVVFGPGGGRVPLPGSAMLAPGDAAKASPSPAPAPLTRRFTRAEAARLSRLSPARLRRLERAGIVEASEWEERGRGHWAYSLPDVVALRAVAPLLQQHVPIGAIASALSGVRRFMPDVKYPLLELRFTLEGRRLIAQSIEGSFDPLTGQMVLAAARTPGATVHVLRPSVGRDRANEAFELYLEAGRIDEDPATMGRAEQLYKRAIELDPWLAIAYTNLGNLRFNRRDTERAEQLYLKAIELDGRQCEAHYNLGYLLLGRDDAAEAVPLFLRAIELDPTFADAYFNVASALEQLGRWEASRPYWRRYIELEPSGTWTEIARRKLR